MKTGNIRSHYRVCLGVFFLIGFLGYWLNSGYLSFSQEPASSLPEANEVVEEEPRQTEIMSDQGSMNFRTGIAVFSGNVQVVDQDVTMTSDELEVKLDEENQIQSLEARGNVVIRQPAQNRVARGGYALYTVGNRTMVLMEEPRLEVGSSVLDKAYKIIYNMDSEQITTEAKPGERTTVTIPSSQDSRKNEAIQ